MPKTKPVTDGRASLNAERYKTQISMRVNRFGAFFVNQCSHSQRCMPINCRRQRCKYTSGGAASGPLPQF
jgi:hypothetical protein